MGYKKILLLPALGLLALQAQATETVPSWSELLRSDPATQTEWAAHYEHGEGVERNMVRAVRLYCSAARKNHVEAQYWLGWLYANGRVGGVDDALAAAWFKKAADQGDEVSRRMLEQLGGPQAASRAECRMPPQEDVIIVHLRNRPANSHYDPRVTEWVNDLAPEYQLDPALVLAVISAESAFKPDAVSPKNAQGLMQLIPATAERFGVRDSFDPLQNLRGGMAYLRWLLAYFQGNVRLALAGYNAGEGAVERYQGIPPYSETRAYVTKIMAAYGRESHPVAPGVTRPSTVLVSMEPTDP
ncbi:MAG: transglycosylase SLT domain-containing protein [Candidatus Competibacteraceae bacterium]|nr:transglycosylase SLT domain-containing protein [Candidatus Competibacteraceae bacterium]